MTGLALALVIGMHTQRLDRTEPRSGALATFLRRRCYWNGTARGIDLPARPARASARNSRPAGNEQIDALD